MTREDAITDIKHSVNWAKENNERWCDSIEVGSLELALEALEQIRAIKGIIDTSNITIQEDVLKYKMIVDIVKGGEPKKEKWQWTDDGETGTFTCSGCAYHAYGKAWEILNGVLRLCPNCGAEMEREEDGIDTE